MGQVEGGVYMGLGEAMMESRCSVASPNRSKRVGSSTSSPSMLEYKSPTFHEMPEVTTYLIEEPDDRGPFGAKEVGQGPLLPIMPAVANAIYDAVGVRVDQIPVHPHMVLRALDAKAKGKGGRFGPAPFPDVDFGERLHVATPAEGGDGRADNERKSRGTMPLESLARTVAAEV